MKHEEPIGVAIGIGEVELLALPKLNLEVLVLIVHEERLEIAQRGSEPVVFVCGLVSDAVCGGNQSALARPHAMFVDHGNRCVETNLTEANVQVARPWLDVDRLCDAIEALCG